jgi:hypothetical protein
MTIKHWRRAWAIIGFAAALALAILSTAATPPYSAPVIRSAEFAVRDRQIEVTLKGVFHAGSKTAQATCGPVVTHFDSRSVQVIANRRGGDEDYPRGIRMAESAKILLPPFFTGLQRVECVFTLVDDEPSSKPIEARTSAPLRTILDTEKLIGKEMLEADPGDVVDVPVAPGAACGDAAGKIGPDGLPAEPPAVVVWGDIVLASVQAPEKIYKGTKWETLWFTKNGLTAWDFDVFTRLPGGERRKLTVNKNDFSRERTPLSLGVLTDCSASMRDTIPDREPGSTGDLTKRSLAEAAAHHVLSSGLQVGMRHVPDSKGGEPKAEFRSTAFVVNFNDRFLLNGEENPGISADHFIKDPQRLSSWISRQGGERIVLRYGTRLLDGVYRAAYEMNGVAALEECKPDPRVTNMREEMEKKRVAEKRSAYTYEESHRLKLLLEDIAAVKRRKALFVISDGLDNGSKIKPETLEEYLSKSGVLVFAINYVKDAQEAAESVLPKLARATGGQALLVNLALPAKVIRALVDEFTAVVLSTLESQYELTFEETLDSCSALEVDAYDTSKLWTSWREMEQNYKRLTCQLESPRPAAPKTDSKSVEGSVKITGSEPEKPACEPNKSAVLVPWEDYYLAHYRDQDIPKLRTTHKNHIGPCTPDQIRDLEGAGTAAPPRPRPKRK